MSSHDEYSSDEEDLFEESGTKSEVFLGFIDGPIDEDDEEDGPTIEDTFVGGKPIWFHPDSQPDEKLITCDNCGKKMALLLQAFAPIDGKLHDRIIYVFACKNTAQCSKKKGSIKSIRAISKDPQRIADIKAEESAKSQRLLDDKLQAETKQKLQIELTKDLFSANYKSEPNPFSSNPFDKQSNPFSATASNVFSTPAEQSKPETGSKASYAEVATKSIPKSKPTKKSNHIDLPSYEGSFVYVEKERLKKLQLEPELEKYKELIDNMDNMDNDDVNEGSSESSSKPLLDANTSKISNMLDDKYFENFSNTVKHNPGQVLRYDLGGKPLLYSGRDEIAKKFVSKDGGFNLPNPGYNPSSRRQFELQLMPKLIMDLENINDAKVGISDILNGMSWGTIIVATDVEDFMPQFDENHVGYIEEWCGVQWEESV